MIRPGQGRTARSIDASATRFGLCVVVAVCGVIALLAVVS